MAESILALVTSRDRAASTVGDLMENAANRGAVWFWSGVFRTAASLLWRDIVERPVQVAGLAFLGLGVYIGIELLFAGLSGLAFYRLSAPSDSLGWQLWFIAPVLVSSLVIGRMLAHWAPGRELAACIVYAIVASVYNLVPMLGDNGVLAALLCVLLVAASAAWGRQRRLRVA